MKIKRYHILLLYVSFALLPLITSMIGHTLFHWYGIPILTLNGFIQGALCAHHLSILSCSRDEIRWDGSSSEYPKI